MAYHPVYGTLFGLDVVVEKIWVHSREGGFGSVECDTVDIGPWIHHSVQFPGGPWPVPLKERKEKTMTWWPYEEQDREEASPRVRGGRFV